MQIFAGFRGVVLFILFSLYIAQSAFCATNGATDMIAKAPEVTATIEAPQQETVLERLNTAQPAAVDSPAVPLQAPPEPQAPAYQSAPANQDIKSTGKAEQNSTPTITPPLSISLSPSDKKANQAIEKSFSLYTRNLKQRFSVWLERSARYIEIMKHILKEKNMPEDLVFLPIVESGFNTKAYSPARAAGPWQFIAGTAKRYGLVIDWWRDERKDPVKSTVAAAEYLKDLHDMFGSWSLALAAYNAGEGRIAKALKRTDSEDFWSLLDTKQIRQETKDYVPRFIAASIIANTPEEYGFRDLTYHEPFEYDEVILYIPVDLDIVAKCAGTSVNVIRELNPELRRWSTPPNTKEYTLRLPVDTADTFIENLAKIPDERLFSYDTYTVRKQESLKKIAARSRVPISTILALNSMAGIERLSAGEKIKLPPRGKYFADVDDKITASKVSTSSLRASKKSRGHGSHRSKIARKGAKSRHDKVAKGKSRTKAKTRRA
ncbi:MAG TPA: transglycosylase SLT domain-containing protein [Dissulfurispiraceae bacterium]|nr:transglycosylase SLT domain-containing protein [Dissulfurispiraceae bacterium]